MNQLEDIVADKEWSKKIGHLFEKDAQWWWHDYTHSDFDGKAFYSNMPPVLINKEKLPKHIVGHLYPAIFTEDCLRVLPCRIPFRRELVISPQPINTHVCYVPMHQYPSRGGREVIKFKDKKLSNALCAMVEYCIDKGIELNG